MQTIYLKHLWHCHADCIGIFFTKSQLLSNIIKEIPAVKWSQTHQCWWLPLSEVNYNLLKSTISTTAALDTSDLKTFLEKRNQLKEAIITRKEPGQSVKKIILPVPQQKEEQITTIQAGQVINPNQIAIINAHILPAMEQQLKLKGYSNSTLKTYLNEVGIFLKTIKTHSADEFTVERLRDYLLYCSEKLRLTENTLHSRINGLKFYYEQVLKREKFFWNIPRPKKGMQLPKVLSKEEMIRLIKAIENIKHKTMIMLGYACGLRVSEITAIELKDIDEERRLLFICRAKGKKDRVVGLSPVMIVMLREYKMKYTPAKYLFEGQQKGSTYSTRSLEAIIKAAKEKAGIRKAGSMHMLRHSFATHLLDKGTDVVFIQKILGHNDIKTTLRYLHVTNKDMINILSPLEDIKDFL